MPKHIPSLISAGFLMALSTVVSAQQAYVPGRQQPFPQGAGMPQAHASYRYTGTPNPQAIAGVQHTVPGPYSNPSATNQMMYPAGQTGVVGYYPVAGAMVQATNGTPSASVGPQRLPQANVQVSELLQTALMQEHDGDTRAALATYQQALQINPADRRTLISAARMQHRLGNLDDAILAYQQSLRFQPNDPVVLNDLGLCLARHGDIHNALGAVSHAVRLSPNSKRYQNNLATLLVESGNLSGALMTLVQAHGPAIGHYNLACLLNRKNQTDQAVSLLNQSLNWDPSLQPAAELLAQLTDGKDRVALLPARSQPNRELDELVIQNPEVQRLGDREPTPASDHSSSITRQSATTPVNESANQGSHSYWQFLEKGKAEPPAVENFPVSLKR